MLNSLSLAENGPGTLAVDLAPLPLDRAWSIGHDPGRGYNAIIRRPRDEPIVAHDHPTPQAAVDEAALWLRTLATIEAAGWAPVFEQPALEPVRLTLGEWAGIIACFGLAACFTVAVLVRG
jgi:hypothetical protein